MVDHHHDWFGHGALYLPDIACFRTAPDSDLHRFGGDYLVSSWMYAGVSGSDPKNSLFFPWDKAQR